MPDQKTLSVYDEQTDAYAKCVDGGAASPSLPRFIDHLPVGARVLDLGCGTGQASAAMMKAGLQVDAVDGSPEMVRMAKDTYGINVKLGYFEDLDAQQLYDGVWANFSLLHATHAEFQFVLGRVRTALKPGGILHLGMKTGEGSKRDRLGRFYSYYTVRDLTDRLQRERMDVIELTEGAEAGLAGSVEPFVVMIARCVDDE